MFNKHEVEWRYKHRERDVETAPAEAEEELEALMEDEEDEWEDDDTMMYGIDVSENNGTVDWEAVKDAGMEFAIIRLGYGRGHLDEEFWDNVQGALDAGLQIGVYYYSYALSHFDARDEAEFLVETLKEGGLTNDKLPLGVWFDMEDADGYKADNDIWDGYMMSEMCNAFIEVCEREGYTTGVYASLSWLVDLLSPEVWGTDKPIWCAQWDSECDWEDAKIWQFTDDLEIGGRAFDGNILMK